MDSWHNFEFVFSLLTKVTYQIFTADPRLVAVCCAFFIFRLRLAAPDIIY
jgi:hypothetical protein